MPPESAEYDFSYHVISTLFPLSILEESEDLTGTNSFQGGARGTDTQVKEQRQTTHLPLSWMKGV